MFKQFLLKESNQYLNEKIGDILSALQDIADDSEHLGTRQLIQNAQSIVNQIRKILHSNWNKSQDNYLRILQNIGVAMMRAIDEKEDLRDVLKNCKKNVEALSAQIGMPINQL